MAMYVSEQDIVTVVDGKGRTLVVQQLDPGDVLDLVEAVGGANSSNRTYFIMATRDAACRTIDGVPVVFPTDVQSIKALARKLGFVGQAAVRIALGIDPDPSKPEAPEAPAADLAAPSLAGADLEAAKNSVGTPS